MPAIADQNGVTGDLRPEVVGAADEAAASLEPAGLEEAVKDLTIKGNIAALPLGIGR